jgi:hypothetical protein
MVMKEGKITLEQEDILPGTRCYWNKTYLE